MAVRRAAAVRSGVELDRAGRPLDTELKSPFDAGPPLCAIVAKARSESAHAERHTMLFITVSSSVWG